MSCTHCHTEIRAYTLQVHVEESDAEVALPFCSTDCVDAWV